MENKDKWIHITFDGEGIRIDTDGLKEFDYFDAMTAMLSWVTDELEVSPRFVTNILVDAVEIGKFQQEEETNKEHGK